MEPNKNTVAAQKKVLLVDDDNFLLNMYSLKFSKNGFEVIACNGPFEALEKLKNGLKPDAMVLDVVMPGMDGIELLQEIKQLHLAETAKVLILTNQGEATDIDRAKKVGIDGYIVKATSIPSEIVKAVSQMIGIVQ